MADTNDNPGAIFGTTTGINTGSAVEAIQAEAAGRDTRPDPPLPPVGFGNSPLITVDEVMSLNPPTHDAPTPPVGPASGALDAFSFHEEVYARVLRTQGGTAPRGGWDAPDPNSPVGVAEFSPPYSASPSTPAPPPISADPQFRQQEAARLATARADAAEFQRDAARTRAERLATAPTGWDAAAHNARAVERGAARPYGTGTPSDSPSTMSAPVNAGAAFDSVAYDENLAAQRLQAAGDAPPPGGWGPAPDPWADRDHGRIDSGTRSRVSDPTAPWARTGDAAPRKAAPRYGSFEEAQQARADIHEDARNLYTARDDFAKIGGDDFKRDVESAEVSAGLREAPEGHGGNVFQRAGRNLREDWNEPSGYGKLNYAFAAGALLQEGGQYFQRTNSGQYVTPEQRETAQAGMMTGAGALIGTAVGSMIAPGAGSWVGGMVGGGIGTVAQGIVGANESRAQETRQAAESLVNSLGEASGKVKEFSAQIEASGVSTQQFGEALASAGSVGTFGPGTTGGVLAMTGAFGEHAGEDWNAITRYTANPLLHDMGNRFSGGTATSDDITGLAYDAAETGDFGGLKTLQQASRDARVKDDPQFQADTKALSDRKGSWWYQTGHFLAGVAGHLGLPTAGKDGIQAAQDDADARKAAVAGGPDPHAQAENDLINQFATLRSQQIVADSGVKEATVGIGLAEARGGGSAEVGTASAGLYAANAAGRAATQSEIGLLQADQANPVNAGRKDELDARIADAQARLSGYDLADAQAQRRVFGLASDESAANFGETSTGQRAAIQAGYYGGKTFAEMQGSENSILSTERARASELRREAASPLISGTAEGARRRSEATALETDTLRQKHDFQAAIYTQRLAGADKDIAAASETVGEKRAFGSSSDVFGAQTHEIETIRAKFAELTGELRAGGLTADQVREKEQQLIAVRGQATQVIAAQREERIASARGGAEDELTSATAPLAHQVRVGGSASVNPAAIDAAFAGILAADRDAVTSYAPDSRERRDAQARLDTDLARKQDETDALNEYRPSAATRLGDTAGRANLRRAETAFSLEQLAPYRSGDPGSAPLTAALGLEKALTGDIALQNRDQTAADADKAQRTKEGRWDDAAEAGYQEGKEGRAERADQDRLRRGQAEHDRAFEMLKALPEMLAGDGGQRGNSVGVVGFAALSAYYTPNVRDGSWGGPHRPPGVSPPGSGPGNAYDGFQAHAAGHAGTPATSAASLTSAIQGLAHGLNTQQLAALLQQIAQTLGRIESNGHGRPASQNGPPRSALGAASQNIGNGFNSNRPAAR